MPSESFKKNRPGKGESRILFPDEYVVIDVETTGLSTDCDEIIEFSGIHILNDQIVNRFSSLVKPSFPVWDEITELTGITNEMLADAPSFCDVIPQILDFLGNHLIVGHNVNFDINFLYDSIFEETGMPLSNDYIDTLRISRKLYPELAHHRLCDIIEHFSLPADASLHRAEPDVMYTYQCFCRMHDDVTKTFESEESFAALFKNKYTYKKYCDARFISAQTDEFDPSHPIYGKVCVFTGVLEKLSRHEAMQLVANLGGTCANSVTKKTNYLILGNNDYCTTIKDGKSTKQKKAEEYLLKGCDIQILPEDSFYEIVFEE